MATSAVTITVADYPNGVEYGREKVRIWGTLAVGAGDYPATGIPVEFSGIVLNANGDVIDGRLDSPSSGFVYVYDRVNKSIRIYVTGTAANDPQNEVATTTPGGVVADTIQFSVTVNKVLGR